MVENPADKIVAFARELYTLREEKEKVEASLKIINARKGELEYQILPKLMEDAEISKMSIQGIGTLHERTVSRANIKVDDRDVAFQWLRDNGHEALIKETVNANTLAAFTKEQLSMNNPVPDFFNASLITSASIRKESK